MILKRRQEAKTRSAAVLWVASVLAFGVVPAANAADPAPATGGSSTAAASSGTGATSGSAAGAAAAGGTSGAPTGDAATGAALGGLPDGSWPALNKNKRPKNDKSQELRVVQDRPFTFQNKFEFGGSYSGVFTDPFLSVSGVNAFVGYHFHDYVALNLMGTWYSNSPSAALNKLREQNGADANINKLKYYYGGELAFSPLFGKLNLLGRMIVYLDIHLTVGLGQIATETGTYLAPSGGIGGSYILGRHYALKLDYRMMQFSEMLRQQNPAQPRFGELFGPRDNFTDVISLGASYLF